MHERAGCFLRCRIIFFPHNVCKECKLSLSAAPGWAWNSRNVTLDVDFSSSAFLVPRLSLTCLFLVLRVMSAFYAYSVLAVCRYQYVYYTISVVLQGTLPVPCCSKLCSCAILPANLLVCQSPVCLFACLPVFLSAIQRKTALVA